MKLIRFFWPLLCFALIASAISHASDIRSKSQPNKPNILFVIMDDVGIDQMASFGYGGLQPPKMPAIDAVAYGGIRFRNTWSMPECSPGRAVLMTGRYPVRSNVYQAIGPNDLNNSHVATWEMTTPKLLDLANYDSAMFGKFHLGGPENNEAGEGAPASLGWSYFYGWTGGLPASIDTTAGMITASSRPHNSYSCGFVPDAAHGGTDNGACYLTVGANASAKCANLSGTNNVGDSVGLQCLNRGGILLPNEMCQTTTPPLVNFETQNAHYVSPLVINRDGAVVEAELTDPRARTFRATIEANSASQWINQHASSPNPWMATVSFSIDHTPLQPPPGALLSPATRAAMNAVVGGADCTSLQAIRVLSDAMIEAMDTEFGRLLLQTGLATRDANGNLVYDPSASNTVIVIVGDNGSLAQTVKPPFDPTRAKATAYQTGVWVPLIVAGPMVVDPGRAVNDMVNEADVFQLFGEIAGIDVKQAVPRPIDSYPMMPYLTNPNQPSLRDYNFSQGGFNIQANGAHNGPCVFPGTSGMPGSCSQTPVTKSVCEDNGGVWWGVGATDPSTYGGGLAECWQVNQSLWQHEGGDYASKRVLVNPQTYSAVRNDNYKLVLNEWQDYDIPTNSPVTVISTEFYQVNENAPNPLIDTAALDLLPGELNQEQQKNFDVLQKRLNSVLASSPACPGDGNGDGVVDDLDVQDYYQIAPWGLSSHYDFNFDGLTNQTDLTAITSHFGPCPKGS